MSKSHVFPFVRSAYNYDTAAASDQSGLRCEDPSLASQAFRDENDPNTVMERFARSGDFSQMVASQPQYNDFIGAPVSYHDAVNQVVAAQHAFMALPARIRSRFDNDPGKFVAFVEDPENLAEAHSLGILNEGFKLPSEEGLDPSPILQGRGAKPSSVAPKGAKASSSVFDDEA